LSCTTTEEMVSVLSMEHNRRSELSVSGEKDCFFAKLVVSAKVQT